MSFRIDGLKLLLLSAAVFPAAASAQSGAEEVQVSSAASESDAASQDDAIIVTGRAQKLYRVETTAATKLPTEPLLSSQNVTVITGDLIRDQGARDAQDIYRNISGVSFFSYAGVTARGFRQEEIFFDGLRGDPYAGFSVPQLFNLERVEFLKGPAGNALSVSLPECAPECITSGEATATAFSLSEGGPHG